MAAKIFCIGFHKTGTSSIRDALKILDYSVMGHFGTNDPDIAQKALERAYELVPQYDAFQDNPWPILYKELDARYPGSKFILLERDPGTWIRSQVRHFGTTETPMRTWIYGVGCPDGNEEVYVERFQRHNREVREHFQQRHLDLLIMNLADGDEWRLLCPFLGTSAPDIPFPHSNKAENRGG